MIAIRSMYAGAVLALSLFAVTSPAGAQLPATVTMSAAGHGYVGMYGGRAALVQCNPSTGARAFAFLNQTNPLQAGGGLMRTWIVRGTNGGDTMVVVTEPTTTPCGDALQPLLFNGHGVLLNGRDWNDHGHVSRQRLHSRPSQFLQQHRASRGLIDTRVFGGPTSAY